MHIALICNEMSKTEKLLVYPGNHSSILIICAHTWIKFGQKLQMLQRIFGTIKPCFIRNMHIGLFDRFQGYTCWWAKKNSSITEHWTTYKVSILRCIVVHRKRGGYMMQKCFRIESELQTLWFYHVQNCRMIFASYNMYFPAFGEVKQL